MWVRTVFDKMPVHSQWVRLLGVRHTEPKHRGVVKGTTGLYRSFPTKTPLYCGGLPTHMTIIEWEEK